MTDQPWDFAAAVTAARRASEAQKAGEQAVRDASSDLAEKERAYRMLLAQQIVKEHASGSAWTVAQDLARGHDLVANARYARDVAKGVFGAAEQRAWRHTADRKDCLEFISWSQRRDIAEGYRQPDGPSDPITYGKRAAS